MVLGIEVDSSPTPPPVLSRKKQQSKFVTVVPDEDVGTNEVMLEKRNYGTLGTTEFRKNTWDATAPLAEKLGVTSQHMVHCVGGGQEDDQKSFEHVQRIITGVVAE